jgi:tRNA dimethylallyltransferase
VERIDALHENDILPIVVGGTGLYINALVYPMQFLPPPADTEIRRKLEQSADNGDNDLYQRLAQVDPITAARLHSNDKKRIIRALEVYALSGRPFSAFETRQNADEAPYDTLIFALNMPRETLYGRIDRRVDAMIKAGLIDEARQLFSESTDFTLPSLQAIGYKELFAYFRGEYTLAEAVETIKRESRRYAKRQLTWFRRDKRINWLDMTEFSSADATAAYITDAVRNFLNGDGCYD